jgi:HSP20 family molecular chaperone IbpA
MQNNPNGPYDDVFTSLARIVEDIVKNMPESHQARVIGYTIITRHEAGADPEIYSGGSPGPDTEVPYEVVESDEDLFITASLPADPRHAPIADIEPDRVRICIGDLITTVMLPHPIDRIHSTYRVHRGVMDISLKKVKIG